MDPFWKSNLGKLIIGGCGAQLGTLGALTAMVISFLFCSLCLLVNGLSIGLTQEVAIEPAPIQVSSSSTDVTLLREKFNLLVSKVIAIQASAPVIPVPITPPPPPLPKPIVMANQGAVNLRSGPGDHYNRLGRLAMGETLEVVGRNSDSSWWLVATPDGSFAWVCDQFVAAFNVTDSIPVVAIPALLVQPAAAGSAGAASSMATPTAGAWVEAPPQPVLPPGTPTAAANQSRRFVQDTLGYKQLIRRLLLPTVSESFSPDGSQIAITEKIKLYTITADGSSSRVLLEDNDTLDLVGGAVWSPDGQYLAFVANQIQDCDPCRVVGLVRLSDGAVTFLKSPAGLGLDLPRWTQEGRLLVNAHPGEPTQGTVYVYETSGQGQVAAGSFVLSSSHDGQKWFPWQPGKTWQVNSVEPVGSYYSD